MNNIMNKASRLVLVVGLALVGGLSSCSEDALDKVNQDKNHAQKVATKFTITDLITQSAYNVVGGDINTYFGIYCEHYTGVYGQAYNAELRSGEPSLSSTYNNAWGSLYANIRNARVVAINAEAEKNFLNKGIAQVLEALNGSILTDTFGDVPFSTAVQGTLQNGRPVTMQPTMDKQADIYKALEKTLDEAIANLAKGNQSAVGGQDLLYAGDATKWTKFAYALKARFAMQTLFRASDKTAALNAVLANIDKSFSSIDEQAAFNPYDATNLNPFFSVQNSRNMLAVSKSFVDKLVERNDPRLTRLFVSPRTHDKANTQVSSATDPLLLPAPNAEPEQVQGKYSEPIASYAQTGNSFLFSFHELLFLKAEALARLNRAAEAETALQEALVVAFANAESDVVAASKSVLDAVTLTTPALTATDVASYFAASVKPLFLANPVKEVMLQKYIATLNAGGESILAYSDIRRTRALGENFITLANKGKFPLRAGYGADDVSANPGVAKAFGDGSYIYTENVWWAGGSR